MARFLSLDEFIAFFREVERRLQSRDDVQQRIANFGGGTAQQSLDVVQRQLRLQRGARVDEIRDRLGLDEIELAVGEALSNAIRHGRQSPKCSIEIDCVASGGELTVRIINSGDRFDPDSVPIPSPSNLQEGGMGLHFMRMMMDKISYAFDETGTTLTLLKRSKPQPSGAEPVRFAAWGS